MTCGEMKGLVWLQKNIKRKVFSSFKAVNKPASAALSSIFSRLVQSFQAVYRFFASLDAAKSR
jgi:hypothetical protein